MIIIRKWESSKLSLLTTRFQVNQLLFSVSSCFYLYLCERSALIPSLSSLCHSHMSALSWGCYPLAHHCRDLQREDREAEEWWGCVGAGQYVGRGVGKEPELPDLNKVNFLAIWPVFVKVGEPWRLIEREWESFIFNALYLKSLRDTKPLNVTF